MAIGNKRKASNTISKQPLDLPSATVHAYAGSTAPEGWDMCDGAAISRTTYASLFAIIGTTYGVGDGSTTFNLPDMRGQFLRALDDMGTAAGAASVDVDGTARTVGQTQSNATAKNGLTATSNTTGSHTHNTLYTRTVVSNSSTGGTMNPDSSNNSKATSSSGSHSHTITIGAGDTETRPQNMGINYIIKL